MRGNPRARRELTAILAERAPLYAKAQHVVDTSALGIEGSVDALAKLVAPAPGHRAP